MGTPTPEDTLTRVMARGHHDRSLAEDLIDGDRNGCK